MADESSIYAVLTAWAPLTALISSRFYDQRVPANVPTPAPTPFVIAAVIAAVPINYVGETPGGYWYRLQFDAYADSKASAKAVVAEIRAAMYAAGYKGCEEMERDLPADDVNLRRISNEWNVLL